MAKTNMLKIFGLFLALNTMTVSALIAQNKALTASQKINDKTRQAKEDSDEINRQVAEAGENLNSVKSNVKTVVSIFEPILHLRLKKRSTATAGISGNESSNSDNTSPGEGYQPGVTQTDINNGTEIIAENEYYNTDGSANLGSQNNDQYGCYLDMATGQVMDDIDAAGNSKNIDLIFTATGSFNEQVPMYAFLTPAYVRNDSFAYNFFKSISG